MEYMKCIKNFKTGEIVRVSDKQAEQNVGSQWGYVSKSEWKKVTRVVEEKENIIVENEEKTPKKKFKKGKKQ